MKIRFNIYKVLVVILSLLNLYFGYKLYIVNNNYIMEVQKVQDYKQELSDTQKILNKVQQDLDRFIEEEKEKKEIKQAEKHLGDNYYLVDVKCTAYNEGNEYCPSNIMANGERVYVGAVAYNDVPLGTKVEIDGVVYTVCDRVEHDGVVDIYMDSLDACFEFGVQYKTIKVYYE